MTDESKPAFMCEEVEITEVERAGARHMYMSLGPTDASILTDILHKRGQVAGILETALMCPIKDYLHVLEVWKSVPTPEKMALEKAKAARKGV